MQCAEQWRTKQRGKLASHPTPQEKQRAEQWRTKQRGKLAAHPTPQEMQCAEWRREMKRGKLAAHPTPQEKQRAEWRKTKRTPRNAVDRTVTGTVHLVLKSHLSSGRRGSAPTTSAIFAPACSTWTLVLQSRGPVEPSERRCPRENSSSKPCGDCSGTTATSAT